MAVSDIDYKAVGDNLLPLLINLQTTKRMLLSSGSIKFEGLNDFIAALDLFIQTVVAEIEKQGLR